MYHLRNRPHEVEMYLSLVHPTVPALYLYSTYPVHQL